MNPLNLTHKHRNFLAHWLYLSILNMALSSFEFFYLRFSSFFFVGVGNTNKMVLIDEFIFFFLFLFFSVHLFSLSWAHTQTKVSKLLLLYKAKKLHIYKHKYSSHWRASSFLYKVMKCVLVAVKMRHQNVYYYDIR